MSFTYDFLPCSVCHRLMVKSERRVVGLSVICQACVSRLLPFFADEILPAEEVPVTITPSVREESPLPDWWQNYAWEDEFSELFCEYPIV